MADAPKDKKAGPAPSTLTPFEHGVWYFFTFLLAAAVIGNLASSALSGGIGATASSWWHAFVGFVLIHIVPILFVVALILSVLFALGIVIALRQLSAANAAHDAFYNPTVVAQDDATVLLGQPKNQQWDRVMNHLNSRSANDWKFAIIEADIMLDDLLDTLQYHGDTMADKLKEAEKGGMRTIDNAWEAHKVRNQIAHEGADYVMSEREARRVVELYRSVFDEFRII